MHQSFETGSYGAEANGNIAGLKCSDLSPNESRQCRRCSGVLISRNKKPEEIAELLARISSVLVGI